MCKRAMLCNARKFEGPSLTVPLHRPDLQAHGHRCTAPAARRLCSSMAALVGAISHPIARRLQRRQQQTRPACCSGSGFGRRRQSVHQMQSSQQHSCLRVHGTRRDQTFSGHLCNLSTAVLCWCRQWPQFSGFHSVFEVQPFHKHADCWSANSTCGLPWCNAIELKHIYHIVVAPAWSTSQLPYLLPLVHAHQAGHAKASIYAPTADCIPA